jgi:hypothetical protein
VDTGDVTLGIDNISGNYAKTGRGRFTLTEYLVSSDVYNTPIWDASLYLYFRNNDWFFRDSGLTTIARCDGLADLAAGTQSAWFDSSAGTAGVDVNGIAQSCSTTPSGAWTPASAIDEIQWPAASKITTVIGKIKIEDRP